jgi:hypothetical protein
MEQLIGRDFDVAGANGDRPLDAASSQLGPLIPCGRDPVSQPSYKDRAQRKLILDVELSGVLELRAATR